MSAFSKVFRPLPGNFGVLPIIVGVPIGTGGRLTVASSTVSAQVPKPRSKVLVTAVCIDGFTAGAGGGAITAQLFKVVGGNSGTRTALTATFDLTSGGITTLDLPLNIALSSASDVTNSLAAADALTIDLVCASTISTQVQAIITVTMALKA